eukprot:TRINITY_DN12375_c0_g1_i1.p1 TRINITY_DN12375_c0_g1~~TRINITY_DN12375_c0_g1_i1.p1  ORF type:complete len:458 (-),score=48.37 TRINITY_DN12375_c0_g1_i1:109-1482(-)
MIVGRRHRFTSACSAFALVCCATDVKAPESVTLACTESLSKLLHQLDVLGNLSVLAESLSIKLDADSVDPQTSALADARRLLHNLELTDALRCTQDVLASADHQASAEAHVLEQIATHPECIVELETKSFAQTRCAQLWYKIGIQVLWAANEMEAANAMWHRATSFQTAVGSAVSSQSHKARGIHWSSLEQTPTVWIDGLRSSPTWDCGNWSWVRTMEASSSRILDEVITVTSHLQSAYPFLSRQGAWEDMFLYDKGVWNEALCLKMPFTCNTLKAELPTKPDVPFVTESNEQIVLFRSKAGTSVSAHCGSSNNVINIHLTLKGALGAKVRVVNEDHWLEDGKALCFQDSYSHAVEHQASGAAERISIVMRVMHPDANMEMLAGVNETDVEDLTRWDTEAALRRELVRLRDVHRQLVASMKMPVPSAGPLPASARQVDAQDDHLLGSCDSNTIVCKG